MQDWLLSFFYPHAFLKKSVGDIAIASVRPSRYLLLNHWTKSNQIWCVSCSHEWGAQRHILFWPCHLGPWGGAKRSNIIKNHWISITKSISKIFKPNYVCLLRNERYKTYQTGFSFGRLGHAPGVGLGGTVGGWGVKIFFFETFNQIWCVSYLHECHMQRHQFLGPRPLGPWGGAKRSNIIKSELQSQFQRFLNQTLCIFSQMKDI